MRERKTNEPTTKTTNTFQTFTLSPLLVTKKENRDEKSTLLLLWEEIYHFCTTLDDDDVGANACYNCLRTADNAQRMYIPTTTTIIIMYTLLLVSPDFDSLFLLETSKRCVI